MTLYYKIRQILLQNATAILLRNATEVYYKMRQVFLQNATVLLQNAVVITKCDSSITKCYSYYKMRRLLQMLRHSDCNDIVV